ncbi:MAG: hypothetical protein ACTSQL_03940 [Promethearchaeota archaeon]
MNNISLKNYIQNGDLFKRHVMGARFNRGKNIPNKNIINFNVVKSPKIKILVNLQGSGNSKYVVNIFQDDQRVTIVHDCPDFKKNTKFCKHIVKVLLLLEPDICKSVCQDIRTINFSANFNLIKQSKTENFIVKAEELIKDSKYYEAINFLEQAHKESNNLDYIKKIADISLKYKLNDQFIKYAVKFKEIRDRITDYPKFISSLFNNIVEFELYRKINTILNLQNLFLDFPKRQVVETIKKMNVSTLENPILRYLLLHKFAPEIYLDDFFKKFPRSSKIDLKTQIAELTLESVKEAILNMESEDNMDGYLAIAKNCNFNNSSEIFSQIGVYKEKLSKLYLEGLKQKHGFLRSLVIANTQSDKLKQMKFNFRYNYPTLIWVSSSRSEIPLYYYILEKCGLERHHLEYLEQSYFIENFPVFNEIFDGNNPVRNPVKIFWGSENPKIKNTVYTDKVIDLDFDMNFNELENFMLLEWDLAQKPILGSYICQFSDGFLIPDSNHPLTHEIKPFDLILCKTTPIAIKAGNIKIIRPLRRINIKTAIELVWEGIEFVSTYIPFEIITQLKKYQIDELDAYDKIDERFKKSFLPKKESVRKYFSNFIQSKILKELNKTYLKIIQKPNYKKKVLRIIGFERHSNIFTDPSYLTGFKSNSLKKQSLQELKLDFKKFVSLKLSELIKSNQLELINLKSLKKFPTFKKWSVKVIYMLRQELLKSKIYKINDISYDIHELSNNYYGIMILNHIEKASRSQILLKSRDKFIISDKGFEDLLDNFEMLKLDPPRVIKSKTNK